MWAAKLAEQSKDPRFARDTSCGYLSLRIHLSGITISISLFTQRSRRLGLGELCECCPYVCVSSCVCVYVIGTLGVYLCLFPNVQSAEKISDGYGKGP